MFQPTSIAERIWAYDASLWTGTDEDQWLGWLDVVERMRHTSAS